MNKFVKRNIGAILSERKMMGENPNFTEVLGSVAAAINSQHGRCKVDVSSFEAVYGQVLQHKFSCSNDEARQCWTVPQWLKVTNDPDFEAYGKDHFHVDDEDVDDDADDSGYFSDGSLPSEEKEEVSDSDFFENLNNKPPGRSSPPMELRRQPPELNTHSEEVLLLPPMELMQQPPKVNILCAFELDVMESSSSDSEKSKSPGKYTVVPLFFLSDDDSSEEENIITGLIPQCNWRFEHCFLKLIPPNYCKHPGGCNNFTHVRYAALWSLQNGINIDDLKSVGLWCREHYHEYTKAVPPDKTDSGTDCR
jgi:hypothetical protein